jgi:hypothetical protein
MISLRSLKVNPIVAKLRVAKIRVAKPLARKRKKTENK